MSQSEFMADTYLPSTAPHANYDVAPGDRDLLVLKGAPQQLMMVANWGEEVAARMRSQKR